MTHFLSWLKFKKKNYRELGFLDSNMDSSAIMNALGWTWTQT